MWGSCDSFSYNFLYNNTRFAISTNYIIEFSSRIKNLIGQLQSVTLNEDNGRCNWVQLDKGTNFGITTGNVYLQYGDYPSDTSQFLNILENNYPYVETTIGITFGLLLPLSFILYYSYKKNTQYRKDLSYIEKANLSNEDTDVNKKNIKKNIKDLIVSRRKGHETIKNSEIVQLFPEYEVYLQNILKNENEESFKYCDSCRIKYPLLYQCSDGTNKCEECS
jgi:hypothetical protein